MVLADVKVRSWEDDYPILTIEMGESERAILTASEIALPRGYLSPSSINMYLRCPLQFYHRYILNIKEPPAIALIEGGVHHSVLETNNRYKKRKKEDLPAAQLVEMFKDKFSDKKQEIEDWEDETENGINARAEGLLSDYIEKFAPKLEPVLIETKVQIDFQSNKADPTDESIKLLGFLDVEGNFTGKETVLDYKTGKKTKTQAELESDIGLSFYGLGSALLLKRKVDIGFCMLKKIKKPVVEWLPATFTQQRNKWFRQIVVRVANAVSLGSFPPCNPAHWCCSERFCGYWRKCRGKK